MKTLFPEMDAETREDRLAAKREQRQRARDYLRGADTSWLINRLLDKGPSSELTMLMEIADENLSEEEHAAQTLAVMRQLWNFWQVGKLWRQSLGVHPGAGCESFRFGIRGVHPIPAK